MENIVIASMKPEEMKYVQGNTKRIYYQSQLTTLYWSHKKIIISKE